VHPGCIGMLASARKFGYRSYEYEARLVLAEIELQSHSAAARPHLAALEKDAKEHGLLLIANHAQAVAQGELARALAVRNSVSTRGRRESPATPALEQFQSGDVPSASPLIS
jgi:hypothetical protein